MLNSWSLKQKLLMLCGMTSLIIVLVGGVNFFSQQKISKIALWVSNVTVVNLNNVGEMNAANSDAMRYLLAMSVFHADPQELANVTKHLEDALKSYKESAANYESLPFIEGEEDLYKQAVAGPWKDFEAKIRKIAQGLSVSDPASVQTAMLEIKNTLRPASATLDQGLEKLTKFLKEDAKRRADEAAQVSHASNALSIALMVIGTLFSMLIGYFFSSSLSKTLNSIVEKLSNGAIEVAAASSQISAAGAELSAAATEQASALQETVASVDEVNAMVGKNAENAKHSQAVSTSSKEATSEGKSAVGEMIQSMDDISRSNANIIQQIEQSNQAISEIVTVINEIGNKTKVINDIVFQTKLLSFNASVEAARAGEHGKGFAVVAEEVGHLAQTSGNAAREISQMLEGSTKKVEGIVADTKRNVEMLVKVGKEKVEAGTTVAKRCGEILDRIVNNVSEVNQRVGEIATASQEQSQGVAEISKAISQLDQVTQQNASAAQQSANATHSLTTQANGLRAIVSSLVATVRGAKAASGTNVTPHARPSKSESPMDNVVPITRSESKVEKPDANLRLVHNEEGPVLKKAVGAHGIPMDDDARFKDV
jgi:methyl-accepting chemotaxis protein